MTKQEFIDSVLAEPNVVEIVADSDQVAETAGNWEKGNFKVVIVEPQGSKNIRNVWYIRNTETDETEYQTANTVAPEKNVYEAKLKALKDYLASNFEAYFIGDLVDLNNNWTEAIVYEVSGQDLIKSTVLVFKKGTNPIAHRKIV